MEPLSDLADPRHKGKRETDYPDGLSHRRKQGKCAALLNDSRMPLARLHHAKAFVEHEFAHGVEGEPRHYVVDVYWLSLVVGHQLRECVDLLNDSWQVCGDGLALC